MKKTKLLKLIVPTLSVGLFIAPITFDNLKHNTSNSQLNNIENLKTDINEPTTVEELFQLLNSNKEEGIKFWNNFCETIIPKIGSENDVNSNFYKLTQSSEFMWQLMNEFGKIVASVNSDDFVYKEWVKILKDKNNVEYFKQMTTNVTFMSNDVFSDNPKFIGTYLNNPFRLQWDLDENSQKKDTPLFGSTYFRETKNRILISLRKDATFSINYSNDRKVSIKYGKNSFDITATFKDLNAPGQNQFVKVNTNVEQEITIDIPQKLINNYFSNYVDGFIQNNGLISKQENKTNTNYTTIIVSIISVFVVVLLISTTLIYLNFNKKDKQNKIK